MRVRCSKGIRVLSHFGNLFLRRSDLIALPNIDSDKAFAVQFELEENITGTPLAYSQAALLYTTSSGERRIRVMNLAIPVTNQLIDIFTSADVEAIVNLMGKMAIEKILDTNIKDAREALVNKLATMLSVYRVAAAGRVTGTGAGQLMTPDSLKQLPLFILALIKSEMMKTSPELHPDYRSSLMMRYRTLGIRQSLQSLYPSMYRVHPMEPTAGLRVPIDEEDEEDEEDDVLTTVTLPTQLNLSSEKYDRRGIFLIDNGDELLVLAGKSSHPDEVMAIFGRNDYGGCEVRKVEDPNSLQSRLGAIIETLRESKPGQWARMTLIPEDSPVSRRWFNYLVEDRQQNVYSYFEFVQHVNNIVMQKTSK
jgi:protein transport protein SEC24